MKGKEESARYSNFELLRIVSILMITFHHLSMTYGLDSENLYIRLWAQFFYVGGKIGVNCFVLIGSYFLINKKFKLKRLIRIHHQMLFYGILCLCIGAYFIPDTVGLNSVVKTFFPLIFSHYWFITTYAGLVCLSPFLNIFVEKLTYEEHGIMILVGTLLFSIIPTLTTQVPYNDNLSWFCYLYLLAAYIKNYKTKIREMIGKKWIFAILWFGIFGTSVVMTMFEKIIPYFQEGINFFSGMYIFPEMLASLSLFLIFEKMSFKSNRINKIGKRTLACYLVQSNITLIPLRISFLNFIFDNISCWLYPLLSILIVLLVFIFTILLELLRETITDINPISLYQSNIENAFEMLSCKIIALIEKNIINI